MPLYDYRCEHGNADAFAEFGEAPETLDCPEGIDGCRAVRYYGTVRLQFTHGRAQWDPTRLTGTLQGNRRLVLQEAKEWCDLPDNRFTPDDMELVDGSGPGGFRSPTGEMTVEPHSPKPKTAV